MKAFSLSVFRSARLSCRVVAILCDASWCLFWRSAELFVFDNFVRTLEIVFNRTTHSIAHAILRRNYFQKRDSSFIPPTTQTWQSFFITHMENSACRTAFSNRNGGTLGRFAKRLNKRS